VLSDQTQPKLIHHQVSMTIALTRLTATGAGDQGDTVWVINDTRTVFGNKVKFLTDTL